ncbi:GOP-3 protein [Aphelenchoides avenae]|nr:GOP-3 protein [Aphelenchus avenae]
MPRRQRSGTGVESASVLGHYHRAEIVVDKCKETPSVLSAVQFHGIGRTKEDALVKEVSELYNSRNLDELIRNAHLAAQHMQEVGLFTGCAALIDASPNSRDNYVVNFIAKEPKPFTLGAKMGMTTQGDADASLNAAKQSCFGRGEFASATYSKTMKGGQSFEFNAHKPLLGWQKYSNFGFDVHRAFGVLPWNKADLTENGVVLHHAGQTWARRLRYTVKLNMMWRFFAPHAGAPFPVREHAGHTTKLSLENSVGIDTRDRKILASRGVLCRLSEEYAGLLGDSAFIKHQVDIQVFAHAFATSGSVCSVRSRSWIRDMMETPRVSVGAGVAFVFRDLIRLELNYVLPLRFVAGDSCAPGFQFGAGISFL